MLSSRIIQTIILVTGVSAAPFCNGSASAISWGLCNEKEVVSTVPIQCATYRVPLDYTDSTSKETLQLELARVSAVAQPSKGSILLNFGGPGEGGRTSLGALASTLLALSGGEYDLIAFDPRGTVNTIPFQCYDNNLEAQSFLLQSVGSNASDVSVGSLWSQGTIAAAACKTRAGRIGELINTPFVARDFMRVVDALGEDGMLRYWGFSYGTTLGATIAAMFPSRIDKIILDGVQNPHEYYNGLANIEEWTQSDYVFSSIFTGCVDVPENCTLSRRNMTASDLEQATWSLLDKVKYEPIVVGETFLMDYNTLKSIITASLYSIDNWPNLTTIIDGLLDDAPTVNLLPFIESITGSYNSDPLISLATTQSLLGIQCGDRRDRASSLDEYMPTVNSLYNISRIYGDATVGAQALCAQWKIEPKEQYTGNFQAKTNGPMLIIGNSGDAQTPVVSARNVSAGFEGSEVLVVNGFGHASIGPASSCTLRHTRAYWANGTLPAPGTVCKVEAKPFSGVSWEEVFRDDGLAASVLTKKGLH